MRDTLGCPLVMLGNVSESHTFALERFRAEAAYSPQNAELRSPTRSNRVYFDAKPP